jgi:hypothetical protein
MNLTVSVHQILFKNLGKSLIETQAMITQAFMEESMSHILVLMEKPKLIETKRGETGEEQSQPLAFSWTSRECSQRISPGRPNSQFHTTMMSYSDCMKMCEMCACPLVTKGLPVAS